MTISQNTKKLAYLLGAKFVDPFMRVRLSEKIDFIGKNSMGHWTPEFHTKVTRRLAEAISI